MIDAFLTKPCRIDLVNLWLSSICSICHFLALTDRRSLCDPLQSDGHCHRQGLSIGDVRFRNELRDSLGKIVNSLEMLD